MAESNDVITHFELNKRLTEFMDSPAVFHDPKAEGVFKRHARLRGVVQGDEG